MVQQSSWSDVPCRVWQGARTSDGYGLINRKHPDGRRWRRLAHRALWEDEHGPIADGFQLDHLCRNRPCVELRHLEVVTHQENIERGRVSRGLVCNRGHSLADGDPNVLYWTSEQTGRTSRLCRACVRARRAERRAVKEVMPDAHTHAG